MCPRRIEEADDSGMWRRAEEGRTSPRGHVGGVRRRRCRVKSMSCAYLFLSFRLTRAALTCARHVEATPTSYHVLTDEQSVIVLTNWKCTELL